MKQIIQEIHYPYDYINPLLHDNPLWDSTPAFRGENQLNIYTNQYQLQTKNHLTGTNPWGYEAAINHQGIVIALNDRVVIPRHGFVLSGNSKGQKFIQEHILLGSRVKIDQANQQIIVMVNELKSAYITFKNRKKEILKRYEKAKNNAEVLDDSTIQKKLEKINQLEKILKHYPTCEKVSNATYQKYNQLILKSNKLFDTLYLLTCNSPKIEARYAWLRPSEKSLDEIKAMLQICKRCHINGIFVESFYNGDIPGISNITQTNQEVLGGYYGQQYQNDYLKALISEAHALKIEIHAWVECFFVGEKHEQWKKTYPEEWHMVNYDGSTIQGNNEEHNEEDFIWLDPANPECLKYVLSIYEELLTRYDFDGLNVDYVRYPHGNLNLSSSNGYTQYAMNEFKQLYHLTGDVKELVKDAHIHDQWVKYRCDKITLLMKSIRELVNRVKPSCKISTAVCSDLNYAIYNKMQNWKIWAKQNWLDLTLPMAYYTGCSEIANATKELVTFNNQKAFSYTGILCYQKDVEEMLFIKQIDTLRANHAEGYALFQLDDVLTNPVVQKMLMISTNKNESIPPHSDFHLLFKTFILQLKKQRKYFLEDISDSLQRLSKIKVHHLDDLIAQLKEIYQKETNKLLQKKLSSFIKILKINRQIQKHTI